MSTGWSSCDRSLVEGIAVLATGLIAGGAILLGAIAMGKTTLAPYKGPPSATIAPSVAPCGPESTTAVQSPHK